MSSTRFTSFRLTHVVCLVALIMLSNKAVLAQSTAFTYQGKLTDAGNPANGVYDLQFRLFDALAGGNQIGSTIPREDVSVSGGVFTVSLDFGAAAFPGANRFLEISVRPGASTGAFTALTPLQPIASTPYAVKSLNATTADGLSVSCVNCVTSAQIGSLPAASGNYIQNTATQQASSNFNISGNGTIGGNLTVNGALSGNGANLTNLNATNITTGTINGSLLALPLTLSGTNPNPLLSVSNLNGTGINSVSQNSYGVVGTSTSSG